MCVLGGFSSPSGTSIRGCLQGRFYVAVIPMTSSFHIFFCHENWKIAQEKKKGSFLIFFLFLAFLRVSLSPWPD